MRRMECLQEFWASIEADFIVNSQVRQHRAKNACPQAYFGMILARISGGFRILNRIRLRPVVAHGKRGGGSCRSGCHGDPAWPIERIVIAIGPFPYPNTCSPQVRMEERVALSRRMCFATGLPRGFLRWTCGR